MARNKPGRFLTNMAKQMASALIQEGFINPKNKNDYLIKKIGLIFSETAAFGSRKSFEEPAGFNLDALDAAYYTDSYIRTAIDKKVDFMFKSGWELVGKNPEAVNYIRQRLSAMSFATSTPLNSFLTDIAMSLVKFHNVFLVKVRKTNSYQFPPGLTATGVYKPEPVVGYYILPAESIKIARNANGKILGYEQSVGTETIEFSPDKIIHIYANKPPGRAYGLPSLVAAIDDIKMLRQAEELTSRYLYKHIFPLLQYKVGTDKEGGRIDSEEIARVKEQLGDLSIDGGVVIPGRHSIEALKQEGLDSSKYLEYFKKRAFTALEVSSTIMGEADTSNRSTSDNLSQMFKDNIKSKQKIMAEFINFFIIFELLLEGGYDPFTEDTDKVEFVFNEIDLDSLIKHQNHLTQMFTQNAITHDELRQGMGKDILSDEEKGQLYYQMITSYLSAEEAKEGTEAADAQSANDNKQNVRKTNSHKLNSNIVADYSKELQNEINSQYQKIKRDIVSLVKSNITDPNQIKVTLYASLRYLTQKASKALEETITAGIFEAMRQTQKNVPKIVNPNISEDVLRNIRKYIETLFNEIDTSLTREPLTTERTIAIFNAYESRLKSISKTELYRAYNRAFASAMRTLGISNARVYNTLNGDVCPICQRHDGEEIDLNEIESLPPFHPNCECMLTILKEDNNR